MWQKIRMINDVLQKGEPGNIQVDERYGQVFTGYAPQAVIDAVNEVLGPDGWTYTADIISTREDDRTCHVAAKVVVEIAGVRREAYGGGTSPGHMGDAMKAATTDALKKALGAFSIGNRAYLGLLEGGNGTAERTGGHNHSTAEKRPASEKQMDLLHALLATVRAKPDFQKLHLDFFNELRKNMDRGLTLAEASRAIDTMRTWGIEPTWESDE